MELMDVGLAIRVYRQLGDAGMVMGLERLRGVEDRKLLAGHIALLYDDYQRAQDLFLASGRPIAALEMRRDLLHWDQALKLAQTLAPEEVPQVSVQHARQLEFKGDYPAALKMFEQALGALQQQQQATQAEAMRGARPSQGGGKGGSEDKEASEALQATALSGIARCTLRLGDLRRGLRYDEFTYASSRSMLDWLIILCRLSFQLLEGVSYSLWCHGGSMNCRPP
jgi:WD repeat-containing protein 19